MIKTVLTMKPAPGRAADLVELFRREAIIDKALTVQGCHNVEVLASELEVLIAATWEDDDAYERWLQHPERNSTNVELNDLLIEPITATTAGGRYEVALAGSQEDAS